jgi:hypothetical protein
VSKEDYLEGFEDGLRCMAHMNSGVYYVGTTGLTLKEAIQKLYDGKLWNQKYSQTPQPDPGGER